MDDSTVAVLIYGMLCYVVGIIIGYCVREPMLESRVAKLEAWQNPANYNDLKEKS